MHDVGEYNETLATYDAQHQLDHIPLACGYLPVVVIVDGSMTSPSNKPASHAVAAERTLGAVVVNLGPCLRRKYQEKYHMVLTLTRTCGVATSVIGSRTVSQVRRAKPRASATK